LQVHNRKYMARDFSAASGSTRRVFLKQQAGLLAGAGMWFAGAGTESAVRVALQNEHTKPGIDIIEGEYLAPLLGKRVGLITNQTGVDSRGQRTIDIFAREQGLKLAAVFSPEHGPAGKASDGRAVSNTIDSATGARIFSLYGESRRPTPEMLSGIDALVFDVQDAGVRFYTYITTMAYAMEEAAKRGIPFFVLDRPNPLGGEMMEGPALDRDHLSFVGYFSMPVRYAMTLGELARMFNAENKTGADLHVIAMRNWRRSETYVDTGLVWIPPSPNLRTLDATFLYPGIEILQAGEVSVGRGTDKPLEMFGAPWIQGKELAAELTRRAIPGVGFTATTFTPRSDAHSGELCEGVSVALRDAEALRSMTMGIEIADTLHRMYPAKFRLEKMIFLLGSQSTVKRLQQGDSPASIVASWTPELDRFRAMRERHLMYGPDGGSKAADQ
jgi:uncharacterized protein YbbC (DUF1343 family)